MENEGFGLGERIKHIRETLGIRSQRKLAEIVEIDYNRIRSLEIDRAKQLLTNEAEQFEVKLKINPWWLMSGRGQMFLTDEGHIVETVYVEKKYQIRILPGTNEKNFASLDQFFFLDQSEKTEQMYRVVKMVGDSMEPTLSDGDAVVIDLNKKQYVNGLYVIMMNEEFLIHRLTFQLDDTVAISSDNTSYKPQIAKKEAINIIGMVILQIKNC